MHTAIIIIGYGHFLDFRFFQFMRRFSSKSTRDWKQYTNSPERSPTPLCSQHRVQHGHMDAANEAEDKEGAPPL